GAVRYLEERKTGFDWGIPNVRVAIVVGAVIDDLALGDARIRPDADAAYKACQAASSAQLEEGNVGVGSGATVGKMLRSKGYNARCGCNQCVFHKDRADQDCDDGFNRSCTCHQSLPHERRR